MNSDGRSRSVVLRVLAAASIAFACTAGIVLAANDGDNPRAKRNAAQDGGRCRGRIGRRLFRVTAAGDKCQDASGGED